MTETPKEEAVIEELDKLDETSAEARTEEDEAQVDAQATVAEGITGDGEGTLADEEGIA